MQLFEEHLLVEEEAEDLLSHQHEGQHVWRHPRGVHELVRLKDEEEEEGQDYLQKGLLA
jgi:hypothetical protein